MWIHKKGMHSNERPRPIILGRHRLIRLRETDWTQVIEIESSPDIAHRHRQRRPVFHVALISWTSVSVHSVEDRRRLCASIFH